MILASPQFADGAELPFYSWYDAENKSPPLVWTDYPKGVVSYVLVCLDVTDPAMPWTHWLVWNIPGNETMLPEGIGQYTQFENGIRQGMNSFLEIGWGGPCPPHGRHCYQFMLFALDCTLTGDYRTWHELADAISGHVLDKADLLAQVEAEKPMVSWEKLREGQGAFNGIR